MLCFYMGTMIMNICQAFLKNPTGLTIKMRKISVDKNIFSEKTLYKITKFGNFYSLCPEKRIPLLYENNI